MITQSTPETFVATWRGNTSTERQVYQQLEAAMQYEAPFRFSPN